MPPVRYLEGTKSPATPGYYTDAQWAALNGVKQLVPALRYGAARPEFMNKVMLPDGTISDNLDAVAAAAALQSKTEPGNLEELNGAIAENRFLFIVDCDMVPRTYFQCAVPGNPDVQLLSDVPVPQPESPSLLARLGSFFTGKAAGVLVLAALMGYAMQDVGVSFIVLIGALDLKHTTANYALDQLYDNKFPAGSILRIRTGGVAGAENADTGTVLAAITLPATPWAAAASGSKAKNGTWQDASADGTGTAAHFRLSDVALGENEEGTVTVTGGGGDMEVDNTSINATQQVTVTTYTRTL